jgi:hypothetical protein
VHVVGSHLEGAAFPVHGRAHHLSDKPT